MSGQSLGLIETVGLTAAVQAADAALKSANVALIGYELSKGGGLVTVKLTGEVGAIKAAVSAGAAAASRVGQVYTSHVIARAACNIDRLIRSQETCAGRQPDTPACASQPPLTLAPQTTIPVMNITAEHDMFDCGQIEEMTFDVPASRDTAAETGDQRITASVDKTVDQAIEKAAEQVAENPPQKPVDSDGGKIKKISRTRVKSSRK